jgi:hypothetical protein
VRPLDLERNDVDGAARAYRELVLRASELEHVRDGAEVLLQLQDDAAELERRLAAIDREPEVAAALRTLER